MGLSTTCAWCGKPLLDEPHAKKHVVEQCEKAPWRQKLAELEAARDSAYQERNQCVALIARMAIALGLRAGIGKHEDKPGEKWEEDWRTLVSVDLPTGQASWHFHDSEVALLEGLPPYPGQWDGHGTQEKYRRVNAARPAAQEGALREALEKCSCGAMAMGVSWISVSLINGDSHARDLCSDCEGDDLPRAALAVQPPKDKPINEEYAKGWNACLAQNSPSQEDQKALRAALENVRMLCARAKARKVPGLKDGELEHLLRFCRKGGVEGSILREESPPPAGDGALPIMQSTKEIENGEHLPQGVGATSQRPQQGERKQYPGLHLGGLSGERPGELRQDGEGARGLVRENGQPGPIEAGDGALREALIQTVSALLAARLSTSESTMIAGVYGFLEDHNSALDRAVDAARAALAGQPK